MLRAVRDWIDDFAALITLFISIANVMFGEVQAAIYFILVACFMVLWDIRKGAAPRISIELTHPKEPTP